MGDSGLSIWWQIQMKGSTLLVIEQAEEYNQTSGKTMSPNFGIKSWRCGPSSSNNWKNLEELNRCDPFSSKIVGDSTNKAFKDLSIWVLPVPLEVKLCRNFFTLPINLPCKSGFFNSYNGTTGVLKPTWAKLLQENWKCFHTKVFAPSQFCLE